MKTAAAKQTRIGHLSVNRKPVSLTRITISRLKMLLDRRLGRNSERLKLWSERRKLLTRNWVLRIATVTKWVRTREIMTTVSVFSRSLRFRRTQDWSRKINWWVDAHLIATLWNRLTPSMTMWGLSFKKASSRKIMKVSLQHLTWISHWISKN